jgi:hypothetical protein
MQSNQLGLGLGPEPRPGRTGIKGRELQNILSMP